MYDESQYSRGHDPATDRDREQDGHSLGLPAGDDDVITVVDEDGISHDFEIADVLEDEGSTYVALIPVYDTAEELLDDTGELVVVKVVADGAEEYLESIDDEAEFDRISKIFMENLSEEYDFEE